MRACPDCRTAYSDRDSHCARDGARLVEVPELEPTASLALAPDSNEPPPRARLAARPTRAASPRGRHKSDRVRPALTEDAPRPEKKRGGTRIRRKNSAEARKGQVVGSYRLLGVLGQGGMGTVFRAEHVRLGRQVALKLLHDEYTQSRDTDARFFREAKAVNRIRHRNIVDITDLCETEDGSSFIIMELLRGQPLSKLIRSGSITLDRGLGILVQICDGLAAAHAVDIVHRDLKPDNIFVSPGRDGRDHVKLLDFGVAKLLSDDGHETRYRTAAGAVVGTPAFMSPEQAGSLRVDARADLYSLGAIMYEMFTGRPPFRAKSFGEYVRMHLDKNPTPPHLVPGAEGIEPRLEDAILRCLEKKPNRRFQSADELRNVLLNILMTVDSQELPIAGQRAVGSKPVPTPAPMQFSPGTPETLVGPMPTPMSPQPQMFQGVAPRKRSFLSTFLVLVLFALAGAAYFYNNSLPNFADLF